LYQFFTYSSRNSHIVIGRTQGTKDIVCEMSWDEDTGELKAISVHPDHRDANLEDILWKKAMQYAKDAGVISPVK
jgi:ribosomal protein S18 acetylase RimI-like enzyme